MKKFLCCLVLFVMCGGCEAEPRRKHADIRAEERAKCVAAEHAGHLPIVYFQDERTGICFAYMFGMGINGGPALVTVPYEQVKDYLDGKVK